MDDEAHKPMFFHNELDLPFPEVDRVFLENVEQRVILGYSHRQFQNVPNEIWHNGTTPTSLRIQVRHIWNRHIVSEVERVVPYLLAIEYPCAEANSAVFLSIGIDLGRTLAKLLLGPIQVPIMIQVVNYY